jgi:hypothetical protein
VGTPLEQAYASYEHTANGQQKSVIDAIATARHMLLPSWQENFQVVIQISRYHLVRKPLAGGSLIEF